LVFDHMTKTRFRNVFIMILDWQEHEVLSIISKRTNIYEGQLFGLCFFFNPRLRRVSQRNGEESQKNCLPKVQISGRIK
jgi:hypothetical protein